jgi:hypothetical protein
LESPLPDPRGHYGFHASPCTPATPREKGSVEAQVRYLKSGFWPARRFADLGELDRLYADWRDRICNVRTHASGRFPVAERPGVGSNANVLVTAPSGGNLGRLLLPCDPQGIVDGDGE